PPPRRFPSFPSLVAGRWRHPAALARRLRPSAVHGGRAAARRWATADAVGVPGAGPQPMPWASPAPASRPVLPRPPPWMIAPGLSSRHAPTPANRPRKKAPAQGPAPDGAGPEAGQGSAPYLLMSTSLVSRRNSAPMTRVITAMPIGYHRP